MLISKSVVTIFFVIVLTVTLTCAKCKVIKENISLGHVLINVEITKMRHKDNVTLVYADLEIKGQDKILKTANLDCITINFGNLKSEKIYIDSVADFLTTDYQAKNNKIKANVYWLFNTNLDENSLGKFQIVVKPDKNKTNNLECFFYGR